MARKKKEPISISDTLKLLDKQWANTSDIAKIGCVGINRAGIIKKTIAQSIETEDCKLPYGLVPMKYVIDYFKLDIKYLKRVEKITRGETNEKFSKA